ncbi:MAG: TIGR04283 family arsenosugar biosynthesis glycosyltransferase [Stellaceae bacterium]
MADRHDPGRHDRVAAAAAPVMDVVVPTLDAAALLPATLAALASSRDAGLIARVIVSDGGSTDATPAVATAHGCAIVSAPRGRGPQLAAGAAAACAPWLLFLHADTVLATGWADAARRFIAQHDDCWPAAAVFRLCFDDPTGTARLLEALVALRVRLFALPYGDQGLLISRRLYRDVGGFHPLPLMEDVDLVRRLGRRRLRVLDATAVTSAARYRGAGYLWRMARNSLCLGMYFSGVQAARIAKHYG